MRDYSAKTLPDCSIHCHKSFNSVCLVNIEGTMTPVKVWQERVEIPTYETGPQDIHPMFLENRVYQGSSGAVYPYGVTDTL
ncbi:hypothetical protein Q9Y79_003771, partial [Escherichia coli]|nr:hypothetical protein [Escherichia coli]MBE0992612.1 hypothetical protein [Escherichia coli]